MIAVERTFPKFAAELSSSADQLTILIATDGSDASAAAFNAVNLIRQRSDCAVRILTVIQPMPVIVPMPEPMIVPPELETQRADAMLALIQTQAQMLSDSRWTAEVSLGDPAETIAARARECGADLIIIGAHRHGLIGRILGEETAMEIARRSDVPLLIASPDMHRLPRRIVAAMDIKPFGLEAMPAMLDSITDARAISCVHVRPTSEFMGIDWAAFDAEYESAIEARFGAVAAGLRKEGLQSDLVVKHGDVTRELCDFIEYFRAEMVVVGINNRRGGKRSRGRLASRILRHVSASVLILPTAPGPRADTFTWPAESTQVLSEAPDWSVAMKTFTSRNAGRPCSVEVDDPELGALVEVRSYPLLGVDYDHRDGCLTIMVGDLKGTDRHLARSVGCPESIAVLSKGGKDAALSIVHGHGQTLLTFE